MVSVGIIIIIIIKLAVKGYPSSFQRPEEPPGSPYLHLCRNASFSVCLRYSVSTGYSLYVVWEHTLLVSPSQSTAMWYELAPSYIPPPVKHTRIVGVLCHHLHCYVLFLLYETFCEFTSSSIIARLIKIIPC